jgi:NIPSNAP
MIIDHRTYTLKSGVIKQYQTIYEEFGYPVQTEYLGQPLGWYTSTDIGALNQIVHLWGYDSLSDRAEKRGRLATDPRWPKYLELATPLIITQENKIITQPNFIKSRT